MAKLVIEMRMFYRESACKVFSKVWARGLEYCTEKTGSWKSANCLRTYHVLYDFIRSIEITGEVLQPGGPTITLSGKMDGKKVIGSMWKEEEMYSRCT